MKSTETTQNPLAKDITLLPGVGEKTAQALKKAQIFNIFDLLLRVPKSVLSQEETCFSMMEPGRNYVVSGRVYTSKVSGIGAKRRLEVVLQDETAKMWAVFFGPAVNFAQKILKNDAEVTLAGEAKDFLGRIQMVHPKILSESPTIEASTNVSTYSQLQGLAPALFKRIVFKATNLLKPWDQADHVPGPLLSSLNMAALKEALLSIHEPKDNSTWDERATCPNFRRLAFEELVSFYLRLNLERSQEKEKNAIAIDARSVGMLSENFLPFKLTAAQEKSSSEIIMDMNNPFAMARLLQGDVGSGKTAVSAIAALHAVSSGLQVAVMAPTEILAEQLYQTYSGFFAKKPFKLALITSSTKTKERKAITNGLKTGDIAIAIGTHALLSQDVSFQKLGLLIIDEQHRFGVKQRATLLKQCGELQGFTPHLLVMSATPIPRSLALTIYGDLELSVIDERPPGRIPIHTQILSGPVLKSLEKLCERIISTKQKAFIVFPLVDESENLDLEHATKALKVLQEKFGQNSTAILHGKMKPEEKALAMLKFKNNEISFLVATTVVEVGVDIPDATCMVIAHPERFGLAQLHQLRGRVGRKDLKSFCFLLTDNKGGPSFKRLNALCQSENGFKLAEIDLEIRGAGELLGTKQSGLPSFLIFDHSEFSSLVSPAKTYARTIQNELSQNHLHLHQNEAHFC